MQAAGLGRKRGWAGALGARHLGQGVVAALEGVRNGIQPRRFKEVLKRAAVLL